MCFYFSLHIEREDYLHMLICGLTSQIFKLGAVKSVCIMEGSDVAKTVWTKILIFFLAI